MIQHHKFIKDDQGWAIDLPSSPFGRGARSMVAGADTFLDILAQGDNEVRLSLSTDPIEGYEILRRTELCGGLIGSIVSGAMYKVDTYKGIEYDHSMWLCPVTMWVFNYYPEKIYFTLN